MIYAYFLYWLKIILLIANYWFVQIEFRYSLTIEFTTLNQLSVFSF